MAENLALDTATVVATSLSAGAINTLIIPDIARATLEPLVTVEPTDPVVDSGVGAQSAPVAAHAATRDVLTEPEMLALLHAEGWPIHLIQAAMRVAWGESRWSPGAVGDGGRSLGLFQLNAATWAPYCGITADSLLDAATNARCAWQVYQYDVARHEGDGWYAWSVKP